MKLAFQKNTQNLFGLFLLLMASLFVASCNKETEELQDVLNEDEIVAVVEGALLADTDGLAAQSEDAVYIAEQYMVKDGLGGGPCGETKDSTVSYNYSNPLVTASYNATFVWTLNCNNASIPQSLDFDRTAEGNYETARMLSDDSAVGDWLVENIVTGANYVINGTYSRQGSQTSKVRNQNAFTSSLLFGLDDLNLDKGTRRIVSGIASFTLTGNGTAGRSFSYEGDLVFNGNGSVTIMVNGHSHTIDLY
ncbi:MAG: hypothetical protein SH848_12645 [Saprospiraceae bacterium]|mgnify:CR=1 FL=1|nr:hypothetical protein [Saprospiraceae bacterium]MDZ4704775.1 hypothetical protein [Saprospiraceae bacterium]